MLLLHTLSFRDVWPGEGISFCLSMQFISGSFPCMPNQLGCKQTTHSSFSCLGDGRQSPSDPNSPAILSFRSNPPPSFVSREQTGITYIHISKQQTSQIHTLILFILFILFIHFVHGLSDQNKGALLLFLLHLFLLLFHTLCPKNVVGNHRVGFCRLVCVTRLAVHQMGLGFLRCHPPG